MKVGFRVADFKSTEEETRDLGFVKSYPDIEESDQKSKWRQECALVRFNIGL